MTLRIAMWSGPRNLSTAMMYSFGARDDARVVDEPLYASYLALTRADHPMRDEVLASQAQDSNAVIDKLLGPCAQPVFYQKHMTHHMVPGISRDWLGQVTNVYLIRHPARVVASYVKKREEPTLADIGFQQQAELFAAYPGIVIDSEDIRANPTGMLELLCSKIGLDFQPGMTSWAPGGHPDDGVWAAHWYSEIHKSTGFAGVEGPLPDLKGAARGLVEAALPYYETLVSQKLSLA